MQKNLFYSKSVVPSKRLMIKDKRFYHKRKTINTDKIMTPIIKHPTPTSPIASQLQN